jgi:hypothetical protein
VKKMTLFQSNDPKEAFMAAIAWVKNNNNDHPDFHIALRDAILMAVSQPNLGLRGSLQIFDSVVVDKNSHVIIAYIDKWKEKVYKKPRRSLYATILPSSCLLATAASLLFIRHGTTTTND